MAQPSDFEARLSAVEARVEEVARDATAARHLAAAADRDLADLGVKVDANRKAINALGVQTASRFDAVDQSLVTIRGLLDRTTAAQQRTAELLAVLVERGER